MQAYATGLYRRKSGDPLRYLAEEAASYVAEGFKAVKLKVGFGVEEDAAVTRAVREAIGPGIAPDGRRQPRLRRERGDPARPA